jgi:hypothetical protein
MGKKKIIEEKAIPAMLAMDHDPPRLGEAGRFNELFV